MMPRAGPLEPGPEARLAANGSTSWANGARSRFQRAAGGVLLSTGLYRLLLPPPELAPGRRRSAARRRLESYVQAALARRNRFEGRLRVPGTRYAIHCDLRDWLVRPVLAEGRLKERHEVAAFARAARPGDVVLDVGANVGLFAFSLVDRIGSAGALHLFEANPEVLSLLRRSLRRHRLESRMLVHAAAVAERSGETARFLLPKSGSSSVGSLVAHEFGLREGHLDIDRWAEVPTVALDDLDRRGTWSRVDLVKIDVEGVEERVVRGAEQMLRRREPRLVMIETAWGSPAHAAMTSLGYSAWVLDPDTGERGAPPAARFWGNIFFAPDPSHPGERRPPSQAARESLERVATTRRA